MVIAAGDHHWRASAEGNGAIDALYRAVDEALAEVLDGHPRLVAFEIHSLGEGTEAEGAVTVRIAPPAVGGERGSGEYPGRLERDQHHRRLDRGLHRGAQRDARRGPLARGARGGGRQRLPRQAPVPAGEARARRAELDEAAGEIDTTDWFNRQG